MSTRELDSLILISTLSFTEQKQNDVLNVTIKAVPCHQKSVQHSTLPLHLDVLPNVRGGN